MTTETERLIDAIVRLIRGTQEGEVTWAVKKLTPALSLTDPKIGVQTAYETEFRGRRLRLYEVAFSSPNLEIIDDNDRSLDLSARKWARRFTQFRPLSNRRREEVLG